jgi:hypothetical protein
MRRSRHPVTNTLDSPRSFRNDSGRFEAHSAGGSVLRDVLIGPVELPSETPVAVLDEEER